MLRSVDSLCFLAVAGGLGVLLAGCKPSEEIRRYQAPQAPAPEAAAKPGGESPHGGAAAKDAALAGRMLAAAVPQGDQAWFFKLTGPVDQVAPHVDAFRALIRSVKFVDGKPTWTLPEGWRQKPASGMRFATLEIGAADQVLELTVIPLPIMGGSEAEYILSNVNRWRGQMQLPPVSADQLGKESEQVTLEGATATVVDLKGTLPAGGMGAGMGGMGGGMFAPPAGAAGGAAAPAAEPKSGP